LIPGSSWRRQKQGGRPSRSLGRHPRLRQAARKLGAEVERFTKVEDIVRRADGMWRVITNKGGW